MRRSEKSRKERECLPEFFKRHIAQVDCCENCGLKIENPSAFNVAHILPKGQGGFPSVMCEDLNIMYLCTSFNKDGEGCHEIFDNAPHKEVVGYPMWKIAKRRFKRFEHLIKEKSIYLLKFME